MRKVTKRVSCLVGEGIVCRKDNLFLIDMLVGDTRLLL